MAGVEQIVFLTHLYHGASADPVILSARGRLQNRLVIFDVADKIRGGGQIEGMVAGIALILQVVDVIDAVLIEGHSVPHIGLLASIQGGPEISPIVVSRLLLLRRSQLGKIFVISRVGKAAVSIGILSAAAE